MLLICVTKRNDVIKIKQLALEKDKNAFIIITDAREVYGLGFKKDWITKNTKFIIKFGILFINN